jgi:hypothetical protein
VAAALILLGDQGDPLPPAPADDHVGRCLGGSTGFTEMLSSDSVGHGRDLRPQSGLESPLGRLGTVGSGTITLES